MNVVWTPWNQILGPVSQQICLWVTDFPPVLLSTPVIIMCGTPDIIGSLKGDRPIAEDTVIILVDLFK